MWSVPWCAIWYFNSANDASSFYASISLELLLHYYTTLCNDDKRWAIFCTAKCGCGEIRIYCKIKTQKPTCFSLILCSDLISCADHYRSMSMHTDLWFFCGTLSSLKYWSSSWSLTYCHTLHISHSMDAIKPDTLDLTPMIASKLTKPVTYMFDINN